MKTRLPLFLYGFLFVLLTFFSQKTYAQINYYEGFENFDYEWSDSDFDYDWFPCSGGYSWTGNFYVYDGEDVYTAETISPSVGTSTGGETTLTYSYSLLDWDTEEAMPNSPSWGNFTVQYSSSATGPWTLLETVSPSNHVVSDDCAQRTVTFTPPAGEVYLRFFATPGPVPGPDGFIDVLLNIDEVFVVESLGDCIGTPAASNTVSSTVFACNTETINLSLSDEYNYSGLSFQWQSSDDGVEYTDVATGGEAKTYSTTQTANTWYQAVVTCNASGESVTSTPIEVVSSGLACNCDIDFDGAVEPITLVNFAGINNVTSAEVDGTPGVENFASLTPGEVVPGQTYTIILEGNTDGDYENYFTVFIDFNQNGDFGDEGESFEAGFVSDSDGEDGQQATASITIPVDAMTGVTYMRVLKLFDAYADDPCSSDAGEGYGQAEDYLLNILCETQAPDADANQTLCSGSVVADLMAEGDVVIWYNDEEGGEALADTDVLAEGIYYAAQMPDGGCESALRTAVAVTLTVVPPPTGDAEQEFDNDPDMLDYPTVSEIEVEILEGATVNWYESEEDALAGENALSGDTQIMADGTYYITQTIDGCESVPFMVGVLLGNEDFAFGSFKYYPNPVDNMLYMSYTSTITNIEVYNLVGQQIIAKNYAVNDVQLDMSGLSAGTYLVKVITGDATKTIKIAKK
ncbi:GEVED domain-containing protein [Flavobacterium beibuense]|nr:GEVED domain-containing protein [Flavobacterium beibuense]